MNGVWQKTQLLLFPTINPSNYSTGTICTHIFKIHHVNSSKCASPNTNFISSFSNTVFEHLQTIESPFNSNVHFNVSKRQRSNFQLGGNGCFWVKYFTTVFKWIDRRVNDAIARLNPDLQKWHTRHLDCICTTYLRHPQVDWKYAGIDLFRWERSVSIPWIPICWNGKGICGHATLNGIKMDNHLPKGVLSTEYHTEH